MGDILLRSIFFIGGAMLVGLAIALIYGQRVISRKRQELDDTESPWQAAETLSDDQPDETCASEDLVGFTHRPRGTHSCDGRYVDETHVQWTVIQIGLWLLAILLWLLGMLIMASSVFLQQWH